MHYHISLELTSASVADVPVSWVTYTRVSVVDFEAVCIYSTQKALGAVWQSCNITCLTVFNFLKCQNTFEINSSNVQQF